MNASARPTMERTRPTVGDSSDERNYVEDGNIECYDRESAENDSYDTKYLIACFHCYILLKRFYYAAI